MNLPVMLVSCLAAGLSGGCQRVTDPPPMAINNTPIVVDPAMLRRDFQPTTAYYANGETIAGPTGIYYESDPRLPAVARGAVETPLFVGQVLLLPFDLLWDPWWEDVVYPRGQAPTSYTAAPPSDRQY